MIDNEDGADARESKNRALAAGVAWCVDEQRAFRGFLGLSLQDAYADSLRQEVPRRFRRLLDRLGAGQGEA